METGLGYKDVKILDQSFRQACLALGCVLVALALVFIFIRFSPYPEDDAFIHFRIAHHLATYGRPFFNLSDPIVASSSPVWTVLLAILIRLLTPDPRFLPVLNALLTFGGAIVFARLVQKVVPRSTHPAYAWLFALIYISLVIYSALGQMETPLALLLMGAGFLLLLDKKPVCMFVFGVMTFTRFELGIFSLIALLYFALSNRPGLIAALVWLALGTLPFAAYSLYFGGSLVPNSVAAKQIIYTLSPEEVLGAIVFNFLPHLALFIVEFNVELLIKGFYFVIVLIVLFTSIFHIELVQRPNDNSRYIVYAIFLGGVVIISAYVWQHVFLFGWYVPLYAVPIVFAIYRTVICHKRNGPLFLLVATLVPWFVIIVLMLTQVAVATLIDKPAYYKDFLLGARVRKYIEIGQSLYESYPDAVLLTSELGGLGYGFQGYLADGAGLVSPRALAFHPMMIPDERSNGSLGSIPVGYVQELNPEIIVSYDIFIEAFLKSDLVGQYEQIKQPMFLQEDLERMLPGQTGHFGELFVFIRKDLYFRKPWQHGAAAPM